ncbi:hypothetical protein C4569_02710 [Candidatus Parcubacteria bacterium]|nr:MAG: hypothetical protein C4569_02710 [Candidatus Parcubacteria bacterium]
MDTTNTVDLRDREMVKGPKALFWFLGLFFSLGVTAVATGGLWFQFINKWFPLEVGYGMVNTRPFSQSVLKMQMASLIVAVPLFYLFSYLVRQAFKSGLLSPDNKVRLWITYVILFITVATTAGDLITTTFFLLNGDFTTRFLLKSLTILVIAGWIFYYFWTELKAKDSLVRSKLPKIMGIISLVFIIGSFIGTFFIIESPLEARRKAFDRTRVNNLSEIKFTVDDYYREFDKLPQSLKNLQETRGYINFIDPKSGEEYGYRILGETSYELCATFDGSNRDDKDEKYFYGGLNTEFLHDAGRNCFSRSVSKNPTDGPKIAPID